MCVGSGAGALRRSGTNIQYFIDFIQVNIHHSFCL